MSCSAFILVKWYGIFGVFLVNIWSVRYAYYVILIFILGYFVLWLVGSVHDYKYFYSSYSDKIINYLSVISLVINAVISVGICKIII